ncbi:MAG: 4Fe-4S binding protein [Deltaproteobacteria bacterium]|nr:4Fe-4S binding protein [Deltaproteobacteria bacterium]MBW2333911.1 4Fe-4S binding protein [Deltaproteobacteria bacterium]
MKKYALIIDHEACWGCKTCEVACKQETNSTDGIKLISVSEDGPKIINGTLDFSFQVSVCRHCDDPPCVKACVEEAISKREDGIVVIDYEKCTGCQACIEVCPYDAIVFDMSKGIAQKCNLCHHRVDRGLIPACADNVCLAHCIYFGDPDEIRQMISKKRRFNKQ